MNSYVDVWSFLFRKEVSGQALLSLTYGSDLNETVSLYLLL